MNNLKENEYYDIWDKNGSFRLDIYDNKGNQVKMITHTPVETETWEETEEAKKLAEIMQEAISNVIFTDEIENKIKAEFERLLKEAEA